MIDSNGHDVRKIPEPIASKLEITHACYACGLYTPTFGSLSCDKMKASVGMRVYQAGGDMDPFAGYRDNWPLVMEEPKPESRPGLAPETIDRDAYDAFMRTLG